MSPRFTRHSVTQVETGVSFDAPRAFAGFIYLFICFNSVDGPFLQIELFPPLGAFQ